VWLIVVLVVLLVVLLMVAMLGVLAWTGMRRYIAASKSAEAVSNVGMIAMDAESTYDVGHELCASASHPVPATMLSVKGVKYASSPSEWQADRAANAGFACLGFDMSYPQYYQYDYQRTGSGTTSGDSFRAIAHGDLDGDGVESEVSRGGKLVGATLVLDPNVKQTNRGE
jgi:type II secretory pathway pseudopilin PulG